MEYTTTRYYTKTAQAFFADTVAVAMDPLYARFLPHIPPGGHILDAGCGLGRDTLAFMQKGYRVTAFDVSPSLAYLQFRGQFRGQFTYFALCGRRS